MTSATDELRRMLDERGVEWHDAIDVNGQQIVQKVTLWGQPKDVEGKPYRHIYHYRATDLGDGRLYLQAQLVTPAQAVEATLGRGVCRIKDGDIVEVNGVHTVYECSECGEQFWAMTFTPDYCPRCGRRVVNR